MATDSKYTALFNNRHPQLLLKEKNWQLILDAYKGGVDFQSGGYLIKYPKESQVSFGKRKERAVYFNQMSPVVDMLSGVMFLNEPVRTIPNELNYLLDNISGKKKLNEFMRLVAAYSFMFTCGILVDVPAYNLELVKTKKDRIAYGINPYATLYFPQKIRDFNVSAEDGNLDWVLLDDSYSEHSDPFKKSEEVTKYTLWTRDTYQSFTKIGRNSDVVAGPIQEHAVGYVPFRFVSWRDDNDDYIGESVCEDIGMLCKLIYNNMSYMDEMLASGTFKMLVYPTKDGTVPDALINGGVGPLSILPVEKDSSLAPQFIGASLDDVEPFIKAIEFYMSEVLKKVGLSTDETKEFVKSGAAKKIDFQKMRALLVSGALTMGNAEEWIFKTAARWESKDYDNQIKIEYTSAFSDEDLQTEVMMLNELLVQPFKKLREHSLKLLVKKLLGNDLKPEDLKEIYDDIESSTKVEQVISNPKDLAKTVTVNQNKSEVNT